MPIDRDDGRHWCAPDRETPDAEGIWVCTGCGLSWTRVTDSLWMLTSEVPAYRMTEQEREAVEAVEAAPVAEEPAKAAPKKPVKAAPKKPVKAAPKKPVKAAPKKGKS